MNRQLKVFICVALLGGLFVAAPIADACAQESSDYLRLGNFPAETQDNVRWFYYGTEGDSPEIEVRRVSDDCTGSVARASYEVNGGSATEGDDFQTTRGTTADLHDPGHGAGPSTRRIPVPLNEDAVLEPAVETATVRLYNPVNAALLEPNTAPLHVIDDEGAVRYSFGRATYSHSETYGQMKIPVFRAGSDVASPSTVSYSVSPTGERPAAEGKDFTVPVDRVVSFGAGDRASTLTLGVINDEVADRGETLAIELAGVDAAIGQTVVTIVDNEESIKPRTRWHHPQDGHTYAYNSWRLREVHVFAKDEGGSDVVRVQFALRRKMSDGSCRWWGGNGFVRRRCGAEQWVRMRFSDGALMSYYRLPALKPSKGTNVRNYLALSRAWDGAGNVETRFVKGRNANTFEVARP